MVIDAAVNDSAPSTALHHTDLVSGATQEPGVIGGTMDTPCDIWTGARNKGGYGIASSNGRLRVVHVLAWEDVHGPVPDGFDVDHVCNVRACRNIDHLRLATRSQNNANQLKRSGTSSQFKGVCWDSRKGKWNAWITKDRKVRWLGRHEKERDAAIAYDTAARELFGQFARLNFPESGEQAA